MRDYYKVLGLKNNASEEEIRARWIKLMINLHPDSPKSKRANSCKAKEINEAYDILKNPTSRAIYDLQRAYERRKRRFHLLKVALPIIFIILPIAFGSVYIYERISQFSFYSSRINKGEPERIDQVMNKNTVSLSLLSGKERFSTEGKLSDSGGELSLKIKEVDHQEIKKEAYKGVKEIVPQKETKGFPSVAEDALASLVRLELDLGLLEIQSAQLPFNPENLNEIVKVIPNGVEREGPKEVKEEVPQEIEPKMDLSQKRLSTKAIEIKQPSALSDKQSGVAEEETKENFKVFQFAEEEEVAQFFEKYIKWYTQKDLKGFLSLFSSKAIQNQKDEFDEIRKAYMKFFDQSQYLQYQLRDLKINIHPNRVEAEGYYEIDQTLKKKGDRKSWKGSIRWTLVRENGALKILCLDYKHEKST